MLNKLHIKSFNALLAIFAGSMFLMGCGGMKVKYYADVEPKLNLFDFFEGNTYAVGQFQDRSGKVIRRFTVDINGTINGNSLTLDEQFVYDDGELDTRVWHIKQVSENQFTGQAGDVIGEAQGASAGNAFYWSYLVDLPYKDSSITVRFKDWMFLQSPDTMINRAEVSKFGFKIGEVTLFFSKRPIT